MKEIIIWRFRFLFYWPWKALALGVGFDFEEQFFAVWLPFLTFEVDFRSQ